MVRTGNKYDRKAAKKAAQREDPELAARVAAKKEAKAAEKAAAKNSSAPQMSKKEERKLKKAEAQRLASKLASAKSSSSMALPSSAAEGIASEAEVLRPRKASNGSISERSTSNNPGATETKAYTTSTNPQATQKGVEDTAEALTASPKEQVVFSYGHTACQNELQDGIYEQKIQNNVSECLFSEAHAFDGYQLSGVSNTAQDSTIQSVAAGLRPSISPKGKEVPLFMHHTSNSPGQHRDDDFMAQPATLLDMKSSTEFIAKRHAFDRTDTASPPSAQDTASDLEAPKKTSTATPPSNLHASQQAEAPSLQSSGQKLSQKPRKVLTASKGRQHHSIRDGSSSDSPYITRSSKSAPPVKAPWSVPPLKPRISMPGGLLSGSYKTDSTTLKPQARSSVFDAFAKRIEVGTQSVPNPPTPWDLKRAQRSNRFAPPPSSPLQPMRIEQTKVKTKQLAPHELDRGRIVFASRAVGHIPPEERWRGHPGTILGRWGDAVFLHMTTTFQTWDRDEKYPGAAWEACARFFPVLAHENEDVRDRLGVMRFAGARVFAKKTWEDFRGVRVAKVCEVERYVAKRTQRDAADVTSIDSVPAATSMSAYGDPDVLAGNHGDPRSRTHPRNPAQGEAFMCEEALQRIEEFLENLVAGRSLKAIKKSGEYPWTPRDLVSIMRYMETKRTGVPPDDAWVEKQLADYEREV